MTFESFPPIAYEWHHIKNCHPSEESFTDDLTVLIVIQISFTRNREKFWDYSSKAS